MRELRALYVLVGSAGDAIPMLESARDLANKGADVLIAHPRSVTIGAYNLMGCTVGTGKEVHAIRDPALLSEGTNDLLRAWTHLLDNYVAPDLEIRATQLTTLVEEFRPTVIVAHSAALEAYAVSTLSDTPLVGWHLQADLELIRSAARTSVAFRLASTLGSDAVRRQPSRARLLRYPLTDGDLIATDPILGGAPTSTLDGAIVPLVGAIPPTPGMIPAREVTWSRSGPLRVLVCTGSHLGPHLRHYLRDRSRRLAEARFDVVVAGPGLGANEWSPGVRYEPWIDLQEALRNVDVVMHHAGVGTACAVISEMKPSVVFPQAFDQFANAERLIGRGLAVRMDPSDPVLSARDAAALDPFTLERAQGELLSPSVALASSTRIIEATARGHREPPSAGDLYPPDKQGDHA